MSAAYELMKHHVGQIVGDAKEAQQRMNEKIWSKERAHFSRIKIARKEMAEEARKKKEEADMMSDSD